MVTHKFSVAWTLMTLVAILIFPLGTVMAQNVHLKGGSRAEPVFSDLGLALSASGALAGLGEGDVLMTLDATADVTATCGNPGTNQHQAPGQNPAPISVSGSVSIPDEEVKNGNTPFAVTTELPTTPIPGAPDCPNASWTEEITDLSFTSAKITVEQGGDVVLVVTCTFSAPTQDGAVDAGDVSCD